MSLHAHVGEVARTQLGLVTRRQLLHRGVPGTTIDKAVASGRLLASERGVYAVLGAPDTGDRALLAAVLAVGGHAVLSHRSAAWLWGLSDAPHRHEVSVPSGHRPRTPPLRVHVSRDLHLATAGLVRGLPVTGLGRTILDCAGLADLDIARLTDEARRRHGISRTLLPSTVLAHARRGRSGIVRLRHHLVFDELPASDFERLFTRWLADHSVAGWQLHHRLVIDGFGPIEIDVAWPAQQVALELEGRDHVDRRLVHDRDAVRQNALLLAGWHVLRFTYARWMGSPEAVLAEIRTALDREGRPNGQR